MIEHLQPGGYTAFTGPPASRAQPELLPEGEAICKTFGLGNQQSGRCSERAVLALAQKQTDPKLWFDHSAAGPGSELNCPGGQPFEHVKTTAGTDVIRYLCLASYKDDVITKTELASFDALSQRLNAIDHPTLSEFSRALYLKIIIDTYSKLDGESLK